MVSNKTGEYYTPPVFVEAARNVLGRIDLDPASCMAANEIVQADYYYSLEKEENGLELPWHGSVYLNPPFKTVRHWVDKLELEKSKGHITDCVFLCKAALGYKWYEALWRKYPTCLVRERIQFINGPGQAKQATSFMYVGGSIQKMWRFVSEFGKFGRMIAPEKGWTVYEEEIE
jgi:ParB family chromosome partitioning protein